MMQVLPLELLQTGERGAIHDLEGEPEFVHRLEEMGLRRGATVEMLRPGSPCILAVDHHRLSFRPEPSTTILVEISG
jgi:ferrous iron transport protein A